MGLRDVFNRGMAKLNPSPLMREIGEMCKVEFAGNRVFMGLKNPSGGLTPKQAKSRARREQFAKLQRNLYLLGFRDVELDESLAEESFPIDSVFVPIDLPQHAGNRRILNKMLGYTDYLKHSHNRFPKDWER